MLALAKVREVYGVRSLILDEGQEDCPVEFDATRLNEPMIHQLLRRAGLDIIERITLFTVPPPPEAQPTAPPATK